MWAQYADNHTGVCLAFDQRRLTDAAMRLAGSRNLKLYKGPVRYPTDDDMPRIFGVEAGAVLGLAHGS